MAKGLWSLPLISTPFWANRYLPSSVASEHFALLEASSSLAYPAPTVVSRAAAPTTTSRISARPPAHTSLRFIVVLLLVCCRPQRVLPSSSSVGLIPRRHTNRPQCIGDEFARRNTKVRVFGAREVSRPSPGRFG